MAITISERAKELLRNQVPYAGTDLPSSPVLALLQEIVDAVNVVAPQVVSVTVNPDAPTNKGIGTTEQITATVVTKYEADDSVVWSTSDPSIATIDQDGLLSNLASGPVTIIATSVFDPSVFGTHEYTVSSE